MKEKALAIFAFIIILALNPITPSPFSSPLWGEGRVRGEETIVLNVRGMSCSQCTKRVEGELKKINGVKNAEANLKEAKVKITFEKGKVTAEQLTEAINNMGYWVEKKR